MSDTQVLLRSIPKVDKFIKHKNFKELSPALLLPLIKKRFTALREAIQSSTVQGFNEDELIQEIINEYADILEPSFKKVINATGTIIHTNLGRSLINVKSFDKAKERATSYSNLEYDLHKGKRGDRYAHVSKIIKALTGCEDVLVVNNNAAAVFLILNTFAKRKEVLVSRGELVEIGGSFRIPEVMKNSGAKLHEVGTTNKTHLKDYEEAINEKTAMLMKVHKSNYSIEGFSQDVAFKSLTKLANQYNILDYYDLGSGHIFDLPFGLKDKEASVMEYMHDDPSLLSFSGDKLLGSAQAGIIIGKKKYIDRLKKNQLLRMLRVDKLTLSILEEDFKSILMGDIQSIPTLEMLYKETSVLEENAQTFYKQINTLCDAQIISTQAMIGGGTTPNKTLPSIGVSIKIKNYKPNKLHDLFRAKNIIGRIENKAFILDFRTLNKDDIPYMVESIRCLTL